MDDQKCKRLGIEFLFSGTYYDIYIVLCNNNIKDFIDSIEDHRIRRKVLAYIERRANRGSQRFNSEIFNHLENGIYEIKPLPVRLLCFF